MNISRFFVDRPVFAGVLSVMIFLGGLLSIFALPISEYPEFVPPSVVVRAAYPGANPAVIAETVATPLEEQINGVENMLYMSSQATTDGTLQLTVTFRIGTDPDQAQQLVQNRVAQAEPRLPEEVRRLGVSVVKSSPDLMLVVHLTSPNGRYDLTYLRNYALLNVRDRLARIDGMGQVQLFGSGDYSMRIWLDPEKTAARGLSANDVVTAIREQNVQAAAGVIGASPSVRRRRVPAVRQRARAPARRRGVRRHHRAHRPRNGRDYRNPRHRPRRARRLGICPSLASFQRAGGRHPRLPGAGLQCHRDRRRGTPHHGRDQADDADGVDYEIVYGHDAIRARLDRRRGSIRCWKPWCWS